jgi:hypothetical protein
MMLKVLMTNKFGVCVDISHHLQMLERLWMTLLCGVMNRSARVQGWLLLLYCVVIKVDIGNTAAIECRYGVVVRMVARFIECSQQ